MKQLMTRALWLLSSLLYIYNSSHAQNNYIAANSLAGVEVRQGGGAGSICPVYKSEFSSNNTETKFFFTAIECAAAYLKFEIFNPTNGTVKITIRTQNGASIVDTRIIASGTSTGEMLLPTYAVNYLWSFESSSLPVTLNNDVISVDKNTTNIIRPKANDIAVPGGTAYRVKAGQTITLGTLTQNPDNSSELELIATTAGTQTIIVQAYNSSTNVVLGESTLAVTVNLSCAFNISNIAQANTNTYNVSISSNRTTRPYFYQIINSSGMVVSTGNTAASNITNTELISVGNIPTGYYTMRFFSTSQTGCGEATKEFNHVNSLDVCNLNATAVRSLNNYIITLPTIAGVSGYDFVLKTPTDSIITQGVTTGSSRSFDFGGRYDGIYTLFLKPNNSTKICSQTLNLVWQNVNTNNVRGYLRKYNGVADFYEIAGAGDFGGTKDGGTGWVVRENRNVIVWQTYVKTLSDATTKAILSIREDSSSSARHISIAVLKNKFQVIQRTVKGGQNVVLLEGPDINAPMWVRIERNGNAAVLKYSLSEPNTDIQNWITINTYSNAFGGWKPVYYKGLYTTSGNMNTLASAEFHRFLGGPYTGTTIVVDNTPNNPPVITSSAAAPLANASVTLTSSACKSGYLIQFYKNVLFAAHRRSEYLPDDLEDDLSLGHQLKSWEYLFPSQCYIARYV